MHRKRAPKLSAPYKVHRNPMANPPRTTITKRANLSRVAGLCSVLLRCTISLTWLMLCRVERVDTWSKSGGATSRPRSSSHRNL